MSFTSENLAGRPDLIRRAFELGGARFNGMRQGAEQKILCPFHDDHMPSLDVNFKSGLFICRSCAESGDAVDFRARQQRISTDEAISLLRRELGIASDSRIATTESRKSYEIRSASGDLVAIHDRTDFPGGKKSFAWKRDGKIGLGGLPVADLPLYRSEQLGSSSAAVIVCEGEKAADALAVEGFLSVGTVTGAPNAPGAAALEVLRGRDVYLWPDHDDVGRRQMRAIATGLVGLASSVRFIAWGEREKDDAADFFTRSGTAEQLERMIAESPEVEQGIPTGRVPVGWQTPAEVLAALPRPKFRYKTGFPALDAATRGGIVTGVLAVIAGWPDAGKTGMAAQMGLKIALEHEVVLVLLTPDGGREATAIRIGGLLDLDQDRLEARDPEEQARLESLLRDRRVFIVDDSLDGMVFERVRTDAEAFRPDLPHVYVLDSAQECLATDAADGLDERHRIVELMRSCYRTVEANPIPSLVLLTSQVTGQSFAPKKRDRSAPIGAPAESKKISFLSHLIVSLEGDPSKPPNYGRAEVVKSKLRGPKPTFGLRVDPASSRLQEIDAIEVDGQRDDERLRKETEALSKIGDEVLELLKREGESNQKFLKERLGIRLATLVKVLGGLKAQGAIVCKQGHRNAVLWSLKTAPEPPVGSA